MDELGLPFEDVNHYGYLRKAEAVLDRVSGENNFVAGALMARTIILF
jgi:hypothetical protein